MSSAAAIIHRQNQYINIFNELGAIDKEHAVDLSVTGIRRTLVFCKMCDRGIFIQCADGRYYIDNQAAVMFRENRRIRMCVMTGAMLIILVIAYLMGIR